MSQILGDAHETEVFPPKLTFLAPFPTLRLFLRVYCAAMNPVVRYQARIAVSYVRTACQDANQPEKAFETLVMQLYEALVSPFPFRK